MTEPTSTTQQPGPFIRPAKPTDSPAVSRICLLTADAGVSAADLHTAGELPGLMYAEPYVNLPECCGFVLVDPTLGEKGEVVGYVLSAFDTRAFERSRKEVWFPPYLEKYPLAAIDAPVTKDTPEHLRNLTPNDKHYIRTIHDPHTADDAQIAFGPAHLHIDILPAYQRQGWGKKLIGALVNYLRDEKGLDAVWLGLDPRNVGGKRFYERLGFKELQGAPNGSMGLRYGYWDDWDLIWDYP